MSDETARNLALSSVEDCVAYLRFKLSMNAGENGESIALPGTYIWNGLEVLKERDTNAARSAASDHVYDALRAIVRVIASAAVFTIQAQCGISPRRILVR
jgi:pyrroline-5-carboxylate reductase